MKLGKFTLVLLLTLIIGGAAIFLSQEKIKEQQNQEAGIVYLQNLQHKVNDVALINIKQEDKVINLERDGDSWSVKEKSNYPADFSKIKSLLLNLRDLKTIEAKTSLAENYGRLGVQSLGESGDLATTQLELFDKAGNKVESLNIGKQKMAKVAGGKASWYVRKTSEEKSWLVSGSLAVATDVDEWLNKDIVDVKSNEIKTVTIVHTDKSKILLAKENVEQSDFTLVNKPKNAKPAQSVINSLATSLQSLSFVDIIPRERFELGKIKPILAEYETFSGLKYKVKLAEKDEKAYIMIDTAAVSDDQEIKMEAVKQGSHLAKWVFEVATFKTTNMKKTMKDLLEGKS